MSVEAKIYSSGMSCILIWFPKSESWSEEDGSDYQDDKEGEPTGPPEKDEKEVQEGNAPKDEVKVEGGEAGPMPEMPTKMPSPEGMNDQENGCGNFLGFRKSQAQPSKYDRSWQFWN